MTKKEALQVLVEHSFLFSDDTKAKLLIAIEKMTEEEINALGLLLAKEQQQEIDSSDQMIKNIDELTTQVDEARGNDQ